MLSTISGRREGQEKDGRLVGWLVGSRMVGRSARCMFWLSERGRLMALAMALATACVCESERGRGRRLKGEMVRGRDGHDVDVAGKEGCTHLQGGAATSCELTI